jgi:predicted nucleotidyltransferase
MITAGSDMRLSAHERDVIREAAAEVFGPDVRVMLFGSRVDDSRRGGDIDLFVEPSDPADIMMKKFGLRRSCRCGSASRKLTLLSPPTLLAPSSRKHVEPELSYER